MADLTLYSQIPARHPEKHSIEEAVREVFRDMAGEWTMTIVPDQGAPWLITIEGPRAFHRMLLVDAEEQNPESIHDAVMEVLGR